MNPQINDWTCHGCGESRPDSKISVATVDISKRFNLKPGMVKHHLRYCNDRPECKLTVDKMNQEAAKVKG